LRNVASCWLYSENMLALHGHMNVKIFLVLEGCFCHCNSDFHFTCASCIISYQATQTAAIFHIFLPFFIYHDVNWGRLPSDFHNLSYSHNHWYSRAVSDFCPPIIFDSTVELKCDGTRWRTGGEVKGNWRMEWVAGTLHTTSEHCVSWITSRLNWRSRRFKWSSPFRRKAK